MNREILFRGFNEKNNKWLHGYFFVNRGKHFVVEDEIQTDPLANWTDFVVNPDTIGQYTGLKDKDGNKIFEGDIISYYTTETYCINPDCDPVVQGYGSKLVKKEHEIKYIDVCFCVDDETYRPLPISYCGVLSEDFDEFKAIIDHGFYFDTNGYKLDDSIIGIEIIGNIYDNPELMK